MLVLSRRPNERIMLDIPACDHPQKVEVTLVRCSVFGCRIGIEAPIGIGIVRDELRYGTPVVDVEAAIEAGAAR